MMSNGHKIEIFFWDDGRISLNYWDVMLGNDVVGEINSIEKPMIKLSEFDSQRPNQYVDFAEFLQRVKESIGEAEKQFG
jgi:hypothetical protein